MHTDYINTGELKNTGDPKYTKWLYCLIKCHSTTWKLLVLEKKISRVWYFFKKKCFIFDTAKDTYNSILYCGIMMRVL